MQKNLFKLVSLLCCLFFTAYSFGQVGQAQQHVWFLKDQKINFSNGGGPVVSSISNNNGTSSDNADFEESGNGIHDLNGDRILSINNSTVYSKYGVLGNLNYYEFGVHDAHIIPKPGSPCSYYIIYSSVYPVIDGGFSSYCYPQDPQNVLQFNNFYAEVDLSANNGAGQLLYSGVELDACNNGTNIAPIAVSKVNSNGERFIYELSRSTGFQREIKKFLISSTGIIAQPSIYTGSFISNVQSLELELSHDGSKLALASTNGNKVYVFHLDANGNLNTTAGTNGNGTSLFAIPSTSNQLTGLEFSPSGNNLFVGSSGDGIFFIDIPNNSVSPNIIPGTLYFGHSHIELAYDPTGNYKMYAVSYGLAGTDHLGELAYPDNIFSLSFNSNFNTNISTFSYGEWIPNANDVKHLPVQIDGEDYIERFSNITSGACCVAINGFDVLNFTAPINATWTNVSNPFGNMPVVRVQSEIRIPAGRTIQMVDLEFQFSEQGKLVIEPGAKLIMTRTTLTSMNCDGLMWKGIELQGNANFDQTPYTQQGYLVMRDNSEINNAYNGISVYGRDASNNINWQSTGGVVQASNSFFRNNIRDVEFLAYTFKNYSYFRNCSFLTDNAINNGASPTAHVTMYLIDGVRFTGCTFKNTTTGLYSDNLRGYGIRSNESKYYVGYHCSTITPIGTPCPDANKVGCVFENLFFGIRAEGGPSFRPVDIRFNDFINNTRGIYLGGTDFSYVVNNQINVAAPISFSYGLYLDNCSGYSVENNEFTTSYPDATYGALVVNSNSGGTTSDVNEIYHNSFDGFDYSATSAFSNVQMLNGNPVTNTGLTFKCNEFNDSKQFDILNIYGGISPFQGSCAPVTSGAHAQANNQFSSTPALVGDLWNENSAVFQMNYRYENGGVLYQTEPRDSYMNWINTTKSLCGTFNPTTSCPQRRFDLTKGQIKEKILQTKVLADDLKEVIDGGNTTSLLVTISNETNPVIIKNTLMGASPYLSDIVLIALINKIPALPNGILKEIILANSPVSSQVQNALDNIQLPSGISNQINDAQTGISEMNELLSDISFWSRESSLYYDELIRVYLHDSTLVGNEDSVKVLLANSDKLMYNKYRLAALNVKMKEYSEAEALINELRLLDDTKLEDYCNYLDVVIELEQTEKKCHTLETDFQKRNVVEGLADKLDESKDCYGAIVMLNKVFGIPYEEYIPFYMDGANKMMQIKPTTKGKIEIQKISIYPNPATDFVTIELLLDDNIMVDAQIYDLTGKLMLTGEVSNQKSYLDVSSLKNGTYLLVIKMVDGTLVNEKLTIK